MQAIIVYNHLGRNTASPVSHPGNGGGLCAGGLLTPSLIAGNTFDGNVAGSLDSGWGEFEQTTGSSELRLLGGSLKLKTFRLGKLGRKKVKRITLGGKAIPFEREGSDLQLKRTVRIEEGQALRVKLA